MTAQEPVLNASFLCTTALKHKSDTVIYNAFYILHINSTRVFKINVWIVMVDSIQDTHICDRQTPIHTVFNSSFVTQTHFVVSPDFPPYPD